MKCVLPELSEDTGQLRDPQLFIRFATKTPYLLSTKEIIRSFPGAFQELSRSFLSEPT
jgi:hypothetical protein